MGNNDDELLERLERIEQVTLETKAQSKSNYTILIGSQDRVGLMQRIVTLEEGQSELMTDSTEMLKVINLTLKQLHSALLGNYGTKKPGLIAVVDRHETILSDLKKFGWIIAGALISLVILQAWNAFQQTIISAAVNGTP